MTEPQQSSQQKKLLLNAVRAMGVIFILAGTACWFNLGGILSTTRLANSQAEKIIGAVLFIVGVCDYLLFPIILNRKIP